MFESFSTETNLVDFSRLAHSAQAEPSIRNICVLCGSRAGADPAFAAAGRRLGAALAKARIGLIYGGGGDGLMAAIACAVLTGGGRVKGTVPGGADAYARKRLILEEADAIVALPGGMETVSELVDEIAWAQLDEQHKPVLLVDIKGFWRPLLLLLDHLTLSGFLPMTGRADILVASRVEDVLPMLRAAASEARPEPCIVGTRTALARHAW
jgi:predicted Rossmann-fold nucleotide-binding protein